jgi:hypothetical protein
MFSLLDIECAVLGDGKRLGHTRQKQISQEVQYSCKTAIIPSLTSAETWWRQMEA